MFNVGDKVCYIGNDEFLNKEEIFTVSYTTQDFICILSDLEEHKKTLQPLPMWEDRVFVNVIKYRKQKIDKIKERICSKKVK